MKTHDQLRFYRYHRTPESCDKGYKLDYTTVEDCSCNFAIIGYLRNHLGENGKQKRIINVPLHTSDPAEAKLKVSQFLSWGSLTPPGSGIEALRGKNVRIEDAIKFFFECGAAEASKGPAVVKKYTEVLRKRLVPWCAVQKIDLIQKFDNAITVRSFFNSWRKHVRLNKSTKYLLTNNELGPRTKRAMLERYRTFLTFCVENEWISTNHAKKIKVEEVDIDPKFGWNKDEYEHIVKTCEQWKDEYGRTGTADAIRNTVLFLTLRYTGQRISDVTIFGPHTLVLEEGQWFASLRQLKTGRHVKVPMPTWVVERLRALPDHGERETKFELVRKGRKYSYGTKFWFWTCNSTMESNTTDNSDHIMDRIRKAEATFVKKGVKSKFEHKSTTHTTRHYFAITMLQAGVAIEDVANWLGHSSSDITKEHYSHANSDFHMASAKKYNEALAKLEGSPSPGPVPAKGTKASRSKRGLTLVSKAS